MVESKKSNWPILVYKFGGASVKDSAGFIRVAEIIERAAEKNRLMVVLSALGKTTNALEGVLESILNGEDWKTKVDVLIEQHLDIASNLGLTIKSDVLILSDQLVEACSQTESRSRQEPSSFDFDKAYDQIISFGEKLSSLILFALLNLRLAESCILIPAGDLISTDSTFREAKVDFDLIAERIEGLVLPELSKQIVLTQGFIGANAQKEPTTLGREGSDYTAAILANLLNAEALSIWKDVDGVLTGDPRRFENVSLHSKLSYRDAAEMTYYGATVIHPKTIKPLADKQIPLYVKSFLRLEGEGTLISPETAQKLAPSIIVKSNQILISVKTRDLAFVTEHDLIFILQAATQVELKINMLQNSAITVSLVTDQEDRKVGKLAR
jgi:aspartate kinase